jgi:hypothetical protein
LMHGDDGTEWYSNGRHSIGRSLKMKVSKE